jgi:tellurite resistance protein
MVEARIDISKNSNRILNIVKAKYSLKDKSQAIEKLTEIYNDDFDKDWELKPNWVKKMKKQIKEEKENPSEVYTTDEELNEIFKGVS